MLELCRPSHWPRHWDLFRKTVLFISMRQMLTEEINRLLEGLFYFLNFAKAANLLISEKTSPLYFSVVIKTWLFLISLWRHIYKNDVYNLHLNTFLCNLNSCVFRMETMSDSEAASVRICIWNLWFRNGLASTLHLRQGCNYCDWSPAKTTTLVKAACLLKLGLSVAVGFVCRFETFIFLQEKFSLEKRMFPVLIHCSFSRPNWDPMSPSARNGLVNCQQLRSHH